MRCTPQARGHPVVSRITIAKFELLRDIYDTTRAQCRALEVEDIDGFSELLRERAVMIDRFAELEAEDPGMPENVVAFPGSETNPRDDELALDTLLNGILEQDRRNEAMLREQIAQVRSEFEPLELGRRAAAGYRTDQGHQMLDRTS